MNDEQKTARDAATDLMIDIQKIIGADNPYFAVELCRYIEYREAERDGRGNVLIAALDEIALNQLASGRKSRMAEIAIEALVVYRGEQGE